MVHPNPNVQTFQEEWNHRFRGRSFQIQTETDREDFLAAVRELVEVVVNSATTTKLSVIFDPSDNCPSFYCHASER